MRTKLLLSLMATALLALSANSLVAQQSNIHVKQVIAANSGKFEYITPYTDYVTLQSFDPSTSASNTFGTIYTQSAQDILIDGGSLYINAQDSIIKYNLNDYSRVVSIADSGLSKLAIYHNRLIVSKQYPLKQYFVEVLDTTDLSVVARVEGISGDCGGIVCSNDKVYIAVNGGWQGTTGKIAVIDPKTWTLDQEIELGADAIGIANLYLFHEKVCSVNKTPYGIPNVGSISVYDPATGIFSNHVIGVKVGNGTGIKDSILYAVFNEGIGSFNLHTMTIADTVIIADPGSAMFAYILSSCIDTINNTIHANIGNYMSDGHCLVASLAGDSLETYQTGISTDVVSVDYRKKSVGISEPLVNKNALLSVYPNPASNHINCIYKGGDDLVNLFITNPQGTVLWQVENVNFRSAFYTVPVCQFPEGMYFLVAKTASGTTVSKFIRAD